MSIYRFGADLAMTASLPRYNMRARETVRIGVLAPLTGDASTWGRPGYEGCRIWADWVNAGGGLRIGGQRRLVEIVAFDDQYDPARAVHGVKQLVLEHGVKIILMLGGDTVPVIADFLTRSRMLATTLLPSDLSPDTPYLIAPSESHPIYTVTGIDWLARSRPDLKRIALCAQTDALGLPSLATYRAACAAAGIEVVRELRYDPQSRDAGAIVAAMMADAPDILCWCTSYTPMVHALTEAAHAAGFGGQLVSCTLDDYPRLVGRTSAAFMEGFVFQFPDFDDPALAEKAFFFNRPKDFYVEYQRRFPGSWSAVSWEYAAILDIWRTAVEHAGSVASLSVLAAMKQSGAVMHAFGPAAWWGADMFGIDNALIGDWPVVQIRDAKARIVEFGSIPAWLERHGALLRAQMVELGQMWDQRQVRPQRNLTSRELA